MNQIEETICSVVLEIARQKNPTIQNVTLEASLIADLQFGSLDLAQLVATMEIKVGLDPFAEGGRIADVKTVKDLCKKYTR